MTDSLFPRILNELPNPEEVQRRAKIIAQFPSGNYSYEERSGYDRFFFEDGAGNEGTIIFKDSDVLIFAYDHESKFNHYDNEPNAQTAFLGLPEAFVPLVDGPDLKWEWDDAEDSIVYASAAVWYDHAQQKWVMSAESLDEFAQQDAESYDDGGFSWIFNDFLSTHFDLTTTVNKLRPNELLADGYNELGLLFKEDYPHPEQLLEGKQVLRVTADDNVDSLKSQDISTLDFAIISEDVDDEVLHELESVKSDGPNHFTILPESYFDVNA